MPEILTESFCERCGTRYTFESVAPRKTRRLGQFKTLSKGMKNWVMSDDSSLDEAMAAARSDQEREVTTQQLDAFHATFNFCMNCRQYTCSNCWNAAEGRCLSCAPNLAGDALPAAFTDATQFEPVRIDAEAWPEMDLPGVFGANAADLGASAPTNGTAGDHDHDHGNGVAPYDDAAAGDGTPLDDDLPAFDAAARLAFLAGDDDAVAEGADPDAVAASDVAANAPEEATHDVSDAVLSTSAEDRASVEETDVTSAAAADETDATSAAAADATAEEAAVVEEPAVFDVEPAGPAPDATLPEDVDGRAAAGAARTAELLGRFRPGQNIDAELAAYEAQLAAEEAQPSDAEVAVETAEVTDVAALDAADAAVVETAEAESVGAEPADADTAEADAIATEATADEPEIAAAPVEDAQSTEPAEPHAREDRIEQPTWRIFAPEPTRPEAPAVPPAGQPGSVPAQASGEPQWPARPEFTESPSMALLANRTSSDALWAASTREVLAAPTGPATVAPAGIQPCSNCGLSLSATARFCRRCGTRQG